MGRKRGGRRRGVIEADSGSYYHRLKIESVDGEAVGVLVWLSKSIGELAIWVFDESNLTIMLEILL